MLDICREACLQGPAHRWAALAMLRHLRSDAYAAPVSRRLSLMAPAPAPEAGSASPTRSQKMADDAGVEAAEGVDPKKDLLARVQERTQVLLEGVDTDETLEATSAAVSQLRDWHAVLEAEDCIATMARAVATGAQAGFIYEEPAYEALANAATVPSAASSALATECTVAPIDSLHPVWLTMRVETGPPGRDNEAEQLWGGAAASEPSGAAGMPRRAAQRLQDALTGPLAERLATWQGCGRTGVLVSVDASAAESAALGAPPRNGDGAVDAEARDTITECVVSMQWCVDVPAVAAADGSVQDCMDAVVTSATDLLRCV